MTTKTDIAELTSEKLEEIRQRYRQTEVPKCHICGAEMTIQRMSASRITYGCAGAIYDETGCHYAEGRSLADDHYAESRITVVDVSDHDVLALVEALEKAQRAQPCEHSMFWDASGVKRCSKCDSAELESRTVKLPREYTCYHGGPEGEDFRERCYLKDSIIRALTDAGIKWEAE
ncbi:TPA: ead/Ea22-like family protein [Klebsiella michiganensis]